MSWFSKWAKSPPLPPEQVTEEFLGFIREQASGVQIEPSDDGGLKVRVGEEPEQTMFLGKMLHDCAEIPGDNPDQRRAVYAKWWGVMGGGHQPIEDAYTSGFEAVRGRIFPKVVQAGFLEQTRHMGEVPHLRLGSTPFSVVFVLDFPDRVSYILPAQAEQLGATFEMLKSAAWKNAQELFPRHEARTMLEDGQAIVMHCMEGHNSARAVLLPDYLEGDEEAAVLLPDRDRFILLPVPPDNNWNPLRQLCRDPYGLPRPLLVRAGDIIAM